MYKIEKKEYGIKYTFSGILTFDETEEILQKTKTTVDSIGKEFCVLVDLTELELFPAAVKTIICKVEKYCIENGLLRSAVLVHDDLTKMQLCIIAKETGIDKIERFFSIYDLNYMHQAMEWVLNGVVSEENTKIQS